MRAMEQLCREQDLLTLGKDNTIRVPFLVKGNLRVPPTVEVDRILKAFSANGGY